MNVAVCDDEQGPVRAMKAKGAEEIELDTFLGATDNFEKRLQSAQ